MGLITADQLVCHAIGDYILQSDWMAGQKTKQHLAAAVHAVLYTVPFVFLTQSPGALAVICGTHFLIDRYRLARYINWVKNVLGSPEDVEITKKACWTQTGYPMDLPPYLAVWLLVATDNIIHIVLNGLAIRFL